MARITIPDTGRCLDDPQEIAAFLAQFGITYERWAVERRVHPDASSEEILAAYAPAVPSVRSFPTILHRCSPRPVIQRP